MHATTAQATPRALPAVRPLGAPIDRLIAIYALVAGAALLFPHRPAWWLLLLGVHLAAAAIGCGVAPARRAWDVVGSSAPRLARHLAAWYALLLIPLLYTELATLNAAVFGGHYFDPLIIRVEELLFRGQPSQAWAAAAPWLWLSEPLHAAYLSYYLLIYGPPIILYAQRRHAAFETAVFTVMLVFFAHYLFFIFFPVQGPRYLFPAPAGGLENGFFYQLTHTLLEAGSSQGAAFPSSHVGVGVAQVIVCYRFLPRLALPAAVLALGLAAGAVYGGFHYLTDAVAGAALALAVVAVVPAAQRALAPPRD